MPDAEDQSVFVNAVTEAQRQAREAQQNIETRRRQAIEKRKPSTEYSPWLKTIDWKIYLQDLNRRELLKLVESFKLENKKLVSII